MADMGRSDDSGATDAELVAQSLAAPSGDVRAFAMLMRRHEGRILANCRYLTGSATDAEDLTQEVMVKAYFGLGSFEERAAFGTWLYRIKINHCLNFNEARARRRHLQAEMPLVPPPGARVEAVGAKRLMAEETGRAVHEILDEMAETLRLPLVLRDMDGLSYQEIADTLGIGLSAVKMRINRARREFRERYGASTTSVTPGE